MADLYKTDVSDFATIPESFFAISISDEEMDNSIPSLKVTITLSFTSIFLKIFSKVPNALNDAFIKAIDAQFPVLTVLLHFLKLSETMTSPCLKSSINTAFVCENDFKQKRNMEVNVISSFIR